jgi:hypothetical protein
MYRLKNKNLHSKELGWQGKGKAEKPKAVVFRRNKDQTRLKKPGSLEKMWVCRHLLQKVYGLVTQKDHYSVECRFANVTFLEM